MELSVVMFPKARFHQPAATHDHNEVLICLEGSGVIVAQGMEYPFSAGEVALIPAGIEHEDIANEPRLQYVIRLIDPELVLHNEVRILPDYNEFFKRLATMALNVTPPENARQQAYRDALAAAFVHLLRAMGHSSERQPSNSTGGFVRKIDALIRQNYADPDFDLSGAIEATGYSAPYFRRVFFKIMGRSPREQLIHVRIEAARDQLELFGSTYSIKTIALQCGFSDPYYFSRVFKQLVGVSPRQFLQKKESA